jgi:hypothetical protein
VVEKAGCNMTLCRAVIRTTSFPAGVHWKLALRFLNSEVCCESLTAITSAGGLRGQVRHGVLSSAVPPSISTDIMWERLHESRERNELPREQIDGECRVKNANVSVELADSECATAGPICGR